MSHSTSVRPQAQSRASYLVFRTLGTRWSDNDAYGHVNNVVYYNWFDTAVNAHLVEHGALDIHLGDTIGLVVQSSCNFFGAGLPANCRDRHAPVAPGVEQREL